MLAAEFTGKIFFFCGSDYLDSSVYGSVPESYFQFFFWTKLTL